MESGTLKDQTHTVGRPNDGRAELWNFPLPFDVMVHIVSYVPVREWPKLEAVSRSFRIAVLASWKLLTRIDIAKFSPRRPPMRLSGLMLLLDTLSRRNKRVKAFLNFCVVTHHITQHTFAAISGFSNLSMVSFAYCRVDLHPLNEFLKVNVHLKVLNLRRSFAYSLKSYDSAYRRKADSQIAAGFSALRALEALDVSFAAKVSGEFLLGIATHQLRELAIGGRWLLEAHLCHFVSGCHQLEILDLSGGTTVLRDVLWEVGKLDQLKSLKIENIQVFDSRDFDGIFGACLHLTELHVENSNVTYSMVRSFIRYFPRLKCLRMTADSSTSEALREVHQLSNLRVLVLGNIQTASYAISQQALSSIGALTALEYLNVGYPVAEPRMLSCLFSIASLTGLCVGGTSFTNNSVPEGALSHECRLTCLKLFNCSAFSDRGMMLLLPLCHHLRDLCLSGTSITDVGLNKVPFFCPNVQEVNVFGCCKLSIAGILRFKQSAPAVRTITTHVSERCTQFDCSAHISLPSRLA